MQTFMKINDLYLYQGRIQGGRGARAPPSEIKKKKEKRGKKEKRKKREKKGEKGGNINWKEMLLTFLWNVVRSCL